MGKLENSYAASDLFRIDVCSVWSVVEPRLAFHKTIHRKHVGKCMQTHAHTNTNIERERNIFAQNRHRINSSATLFVGIYVNDFVNSNSWPT